MKKIIPLLALLMLAACSKEPSQKEIAQVLDKEIQTNNQNVEKVQQTLTDTFNSLSSFLPTDKNQTSEEKQPSTASKLVANVKDTLILKLTDVQKIGKCSEKNDVYTCKVKLSLQNNLGMSENTTDVQFAKSENGDWIYIVNNDIPPIPSNK